MPSASADRFSADGTGSFPDAEIRSADALGIYQQGSRSHRQQNVRMRYDSMMIGNMCRWCALLLVLGALLVTPNAQSKPAKKKGKTTTAEASPAPEAPPSLEPKAVDILKAASSRLAAARTMK